MKPIAFFLVSKAALLAFLGLTGRPPTECQVRGVYEEVAVPGGALASTSGYGLVEVSAVFVPASIQSGTYELTVTRRDSDMYRDSGSGLLVATRYCYEYAYSQEAILRYRALGGAGAGTLIFLDE